MGLFTTPLRVGLEPTPTKHCGKSDPDKMIQDTVHQVGLALQLNIDEM